MPGSGRSKTKKPQQKRRFLCPASTQGGKTEMGPPWLLREIQLRGPGGLHDRHPDVHGGGGTRTAR